MAQIQKLEVQNEVKCSADQLYGLFTHNAPQLPNYLPKIFKSVQVIGDGPDGVRLGTGFVWDFILEDGSSVMTKERITAVDNKNRSITYSVLEGDVMNYYKSFDFKLAITPKGTTDGTSLVKCSVEFEKANEDVPTPTAIIKCWEVTIKELNLLLLKQA